MSIAFQPDERPALAPSGSWKIDPAHSSLEFAVTHLMIATVKGRFTDFEATIETGEAEARASAVIQATSISTNEADRDRHLRSPDFFDVETYPELRFESTRIERIRNGVFQVIGQLTIKGVTREVGLEATVLGTARDPWGNDRVALEVRGEIDRRDFGLAWNHLLEAGGVLVSDTVRLALDVTAVKTPESEQPTPPQREEG